MYCDYPDAVYLSAVRWLSRAASLKRLWNIRQEIKLFMRSKHQNVAFLCDENWLNDLALLSDITQHQSELNLKLQLKSQIVNKLFEHIYAFEKNFLAVSDSVGLSHADPFYVSCSQEDGISLF